VESLLRIVLLVRSAGSPSAAAVGANVQPRCPDVSSLRILGRLAHRVAHGARTPTLQPPGARQRGLTPPSSLERPMAPCVCAVREGNNTNDTPVVRLVVASHAHHTSRAVGRREPCPSGPPTTKPNRRELPSELHAAYRYQRPEFEVDGEIVPSCSTNCVVPLHAMSWRESFGMI
jgi:hypothetical protein